MKINIELIKTIVIILFVGAIAYFFSNQWFQNRLSQERDITILQIQNKIYETIKTTREIEINAFEIDENEEIQIIDTIILIESNGK